MRAVPPLLCCLLLLLVLCTPLAAQRDLAELRSRAEAGDVPTDDPCVISKPPRFASSTNSLESVMLLST